MTAAEREIGNGYSGDLRVLRHVS